MRFKIWLEATVNRALFLVHPDFALDNWPNIKHLANLKKYYHDVMEYVDNFQGQVLIHSFAPRHAKDIDGSYGATGRENIEEYFKFKKWMESSKAKVIVEKKELCENPDELFSLIENLSDRAEVYWGGGYLNSCLSRTLQFVQDFELEMNKKMVSFIPVKKLIYLPGALPTTYEDEMYNNASDKDKQSRLNILKHQTQFLPNIFRKSIEK